MPQWAGSSWYFLRYMDPDNDQQLVSKEAEAYWGPVDWYNGGMEHTTLHLLYSRFWHKGEQLNIQISGDYIRDPNWFANLPFTTINEGNSTIFTGGSEDEQSWIQVPVIPPKYESSTLVIR